MSPSVATFCFHDHEAQPKLPIKHFSREMQHQRLRALLYTMFLYKYNESIDEYETLDWNVSLRLLWMMFKRLIMYTFQKQPFLDVLRNRCSWKFSKIHSRTPVLEYLLSHIKNRLRYGCFHVNFAKFFRTLFLQYTSERLLLTFCCSSPIKKNLSDALTIGWLQWTLSNSSSQGEFEFVRIMETSD